ncbi:14591_t:CDS:2, partial [Dentiscutata erythropus]
MTFSRLCAIGDEFVISNTIAGYACSSLQVVNSEFSDLIALSCRCCNSVMEGYCPSFIKPPPTKIQPVSSRDYSVTEKIALEKEIDQLLLQDVIETLPKDSP